MVLAAYYCEKIPEEVNLIKKMVTQAQLYRLQARMPCPRCSGSVVVWCIKMIAHCTREDLGAGAGGQGLGFCNPHRRTVSTNLYLALGFIFLPLYSSENQACNIQAFVNHFESNLWL